MTSLPDDYEQRSVLCLRVAMVVTPVLRRLFISSSVFFSFFFSIISDRNLYFNLNASKSLGYSADLLWISLTILAVS